MAYTTGKMATMRLIYENKGVAVVVDLDATFFGALGAGQTLAITT